MDQHSINMDNENEIEGSSNENRTLRTENVQQRIPCANIQQRITHGIRCLDPLPNEACIFRVHRELRQVNEQAYTPKLVSIGPYHHGKPELNAMEEHKKRYLDSLIKRTNKSVECYVVAMIKLESRARNCYADTFELGGEKSFVELMILDGCFIIEFLLKNDLGELGDDDDPIFNQDWMKYKIHHDLMLLENQLPFFVFLELGHISGLFDLQQQVSNAVIRMFPPAAYFSNDLSSKFDKSKHFLDLVHNVCRPSTAPNNESSPNSFPKETCWNLTCVFGEVGVNLEANEACWNMPCATELGEAGVKFKANSGDISQINIFDLKFEWNFRFQKVLKIPKLQVNDSTETFFRNIIAYEQHSPGDEPKYFTDYTHFMDLLINSKDDVKELRRHNIIENLLGDEEAVARMFNKLGDGVLSPQRNYSKLCEEVKAHCGRWWNKANAKLKHDYFNNPWAGVSTIAAVILLVLTLLQTLASLNLFSRN